MNLLSKSVEVIEFISEYIKYKRNIYNHKGNCDKCKNNDSCHSYYELELYSDLYTDEELFELYDDYIKPFIEKYDK